MVPGNGRLNAVKKNKKKNKYSRRFERWPFVRGNDEVVPSVHCRLVAEKKLTLVTAPVHEADKMAARPRGELGPVQTLNYS